MSICSRILAMFCLILLSPPLSAQTDSSKLRISLLTCGPGGDLYSIWGHTAIRLIDTTRQADVVFNYGTFDDSDPLFYIKFTRGIMIYSVAPYAFTDFMTEYQQDGRSVTEQVLQLNTAEKTHLAAALWKNTEKENRDYPYHFYADNCTTRARDILMKHMDTGVQYKNIRPQPATSTYRQLIHSYMNSSSQAWNRLAIDVLLGNHLDETMTNKQAMFLPDYLMKGFDSAALRGTALVMQTNQLLPDARQNSGSLFTPVLFFSVILLALLTRSILKNKRAQKTALMLDSVLFLLTGLLGILMLILWLARVDNVCRNNYNLLWALPTHAIIAFVVHKQKTWIKYYWLGTAILNALLLLSWKWLPQEMNSSLLLLVIILLFRSIVRWQNIRRP